MPKSIFIDPKEVRKSQILKINDIPINQYKPDIKKEIKSIWDFLFFVLTFFGVYFIGITLNLPTWLISLILVTILFIDRYYFRNKGG